MKRSTIDIWVGAFVAAVTPVQAQVRRAATTAVPTVITSPVPVFRLTTTAGRRPDTKAAGARAVPPLTPQDKVDIAKAASVVVTTAETPIRLTASVTRIPDRASLTVFDATVETFPNPGEEGLIELPLNTSMHMQLRFLQGGQAHLLDCLGAGREPGVSLALDMQVGEWSKKTQLVIPPGWHHITAILIPENAGIYMVGVWPHNTLDLKYCEITPLK